MKAVVYYETGGPEVFRYEDVPDPECRPGGVLIQVEAISIEGGDTLNRAGGLMTSTPHIVGYQCAGTIVEVGDGVGEGVGDGVDERSVGQRVVATMLSGSHAELVSVPAAFTWPLPAEGDVVALACVPIAFGTASDCLVEFGHLVAGEMVLIQAGASGVGVAAIQLAKRAGATVLATASSDERLERLKPLGLDHGVNYSGGNDWVRDVRALTGTQGVDLVVDSVGGPTLAGSVACLGYRGRAISVGNAGRDPKPLDISLLSAGNQSLTGVFFGAGRLQVVVDRTFPLSEAAAAHAYLESRQAVGRVVLVP